ncbi:thioredoxin family protein [Reichenbachiella versicolor]|uniref:thioredoxin family protein n=1 Tax=Reichenbachiella versicolor TaxID=1821036 RepID=UPI000D6E39CB|nr:thioredoxin fold domain-containing protein [Reichenbachiella versicolor]
MKKFIFILICFPFGLVAQLKDLTFEEIELLRSNESRPIAVFLYSDWCKYCHYMKTTTLRDEEVIRLLNEKYYFSFLNVEDDRDIHFNGFYSDYIPTGREAEVYQLNKVLTSISKNYPYPTFLIFDSSMKIIFQYEGFIDHRTLAYSLKHLTKPQKGENTVE